MKMTGAKILLNLGLGVLALCVVVLVIPSPMRRTAPQDAFPGMARADLEDLFLASVKYADRHGGRLPPDLDTILGEDLFKTMTPQAKTELKGQVVYMGANRVYDYKDDKTCFATYRWPSIGEATIYDSEKVEAIVYGGKAIVVYRGYEADDIGTKHLVPIENR